MGESTTVKIAAGGKYDLRCMFRPSMTGTATAK